ncbi:hypothetical protein COCON_G00218470 [Conger conger]|uniref:Nuclear factor of activated T cells 3 n=1 Tax=Conger conger TaxID=82655 RepID=A0A9Q1CYH7_CONCO|nr:hypothetical protein COCON_G00218470 [Conger conger]
MIVIGRIKSRRSRSTTNTFILNLSIADLSFLLLCVPFQATIYSLPDWVFGAFLCKSVHYFVMVCMLVSIFTLVAMSVDRYIAVVHAKKSPCIRNKKNAIIGVLFHLHKKIKNMSKKSERSKRKTAQTVLLVVTAFLICWMPHHIIAMWVEFGRFPLNDASFAFRIVSHCLAYGNSCVNPILYAFLSENFRKACQQVFTCRLFFPPPPVEKVVRIRMENFSTTHSTTNLSVESRRAPEVLFVVRRSTNPAKSLPLEQQANYAAPLVSAKLGFWQDWESSPGSRCQGLLLFPQEFQARAQPPSGNEELDFRLIFGEDGQQQSLGPADLEQDDNPAYYILNVGQPPSVLNQPIGIPRHGLQTHSPVISAPPRLQHHKAYEPLYEAPGSRYSPAGGHKAFECPSIQITSISPNCQQEMEANEEDRRGNGQEGEYQDRPLSRDHLYLPLDHSYRDASLSPSPCSSLSSRSWFSDASSCESFSHVYDDVDSELNEAAARFTLGSPQAGPGEDPWQHPLPVFGHSLSPRQSPCHSPRTSVTDENWLSPRPQSRPSSRPTSPCGKRRHSSADICYPNSASPHHSPTATPGHSPRGSVTEDTWIGSPSGGLSPFQCCPSEADIPSKTRRTSQDRTAMLSGKVDLGLEDPGSLSPSLESPGDDSGHALKKDGPGEQFLSVPSHFTWNKPKPGHTPIFRTSSLPPLDWPLPSQFGQYELKIEVQPKAHHRAHYETEGSRGAVKASSGGHPVVKLVGYNEKPINLQMFIGTADDRYLRPHAFYQVHRITGKTVATASQEIIISSTKVLEIPLLPENNMSASIDCAGILKLRNSDIELRKGETDIGRKNTRVRAVFRVHIPQPGGKVLSLQASSIPVECSQRSAQELPQVEKYSLNSCSVSGGEEMAITGSNFFPETKVIFLEKGPDGRPQWEVDAKIIREKSQGSTIVVEVPPYHSKALASAVQVQFYVCNGKRKRSQSQRFTYLSGAHRKYALALRGGGSAGRRRGRGRGLFINGRPRGGVAGAPLRPREGREARRRATAKQEPPCPVLCAPACQARSAAAPPCRSARPLRPANPPFRLCRRLPAHKRVVSLGSNHGEAGAQGGPGPAPAQPMPLSHPLAHPARTQLPSPDGSPRGLLPVYPPMAAPFQQLPRLQSCQLIGSPLPFHPAPAPPPRPSYPPLQHSLPYNGQPSLPMSAGSAQGYEHLPFQPDPLGLGLGYHSASTPPSAGSQPLSHLHSLGYPCPNPVQVPSPSHPRAQLQHSLGYPSTGQRAASCPSPTNAPLPMVPSPHSGPSSPQLHSLPYQSPTGGPASSPSPTSSSPLVLLPSPQASSPGLGSLPLGPQPPFSPEGERLSIKQEPEDKELTFQSIGLQDITLDDVNEIIGRDMSQTAGSTGRTALGLAHARHHGDLELNPVALVSSPPSSSSLPKTVLMDKNTFYNYIFDTLKMVVIPKADVVWGPPRGAVPGPRSAAAGQVDGVSGEGVVGSLGHSPPRGLLAGEGHQGLAAALAAEVVQQEDGVWQDLDEGEDTSRAGLRPQASPPPAFNGGRTAALHPDQGSVLGQHGRGGRGRHCGRHGTRGRRKVAHRGGGDGGAGAELGVGLGWVEGQGRGSAVGRGLGGTRCGQQGGLVQGCLRGQQGGRSREGNVDTAEVTLERWTISPNQSASTSLYKQTFTWQIRTAFQALTDADYDETKAVSLCK